MIREITFLAEVTEYSVEYGKDYTNIREITLLVHPDQQTLTLKEIAPPKHVMMKFDLYEATINPNYPIPLVNIIRLIMFGQS